MNKKELEFLEKVFAKEIDGGVFQTKSKMARKLEDEGYIQKVRMSFGRDRLGEITADGYVLTIKGNITYCSSF